MKKKNLFSLVFLLFFLFLARGGWLQIPIRLDTGDLPGANYSMNTQISNSGSNVYVVWEDYRNGDADIYFNSSTDGGVTWQALDTRLDTGNSPGASNSWYPQISSIGSYVYVVWMDGRNGGVFDRADIYRDGSQIYRIQTNLENEWVRI